MCFHDLVYKNRKTMQFKLCSFASDIQKETKRRKGHVNIQLYTSVTSTHTEKKFTTWVRKSDVKIDYLELKYACTTLTYMFVRVFILVCQHIL